MGSVPIAGTELSRSEPSLGNDRAPFECEFCELHITIGPRSTDPPMLDADTVNWPDRNEG